MRAIVHAPSAPPAHDAHRQLAARTAVVTLVASAVIGLAALVVSTAEIWLVVFSGLLLAVLLGSAADAMSRRLGLSRGVALALAVIAITAALVAAAFLLWPSVSRQIDQLSRDLPAAVDSLQDWLGRRPWGEWLLGRAEPEMLENRRMLGRATGAVTSTARAAGTLLVILFVGLYVAAQPGVYRGGLRRLVPPGGRQRFDEVAAEVVQVLRWWLVGKLLSMTLVGVLTTAGLFLLDVPLALTFGLIAALLTFVPNFGPLLSVVPPALLAVASDPRLAAYVVLLYLGIQTVESYAITPLIQRRTVAMPPALTITAQVLLGVLVGAIGVAVATPLTATALTLVRLLYVEDLVERDADVDEAPATRV